MGIDFVNFDWFLLVLISFRSLPRLLAVSSLQGRFFCIWVEKFLEIRADPLIVWATWLY